jgi:hypothetical protein
MTNAEAMHELSIWYALGASNNRLIETLSSTDEAFRASLNSRPYDSALYRELGEILTHQGLDEGQICEVINTTTAGFAVRRACPWIRLTTEEYRHARARIPSPENEPNVAWPASIVTVNRRIGAGTWNGVLTRLGIEVQIGPHIGGLKFSHQSYLEAIDDFVHICFANFIYPSANNYEKRRLNSAWSYPSLGSLRLHFGSWTAAANSSALYRYGMTARRWDTGYKLGFTWDSEESDWDD